MGVDYFWLNNLRGTNIFPSNFNQNQKRPMMQEKSVSSGSLKINIYSFILIILYAIYAFIGVNPLRMNEVIPNLESPNYPNFVLIPVAIIIIFVMLYGIIRDRRTSRKCGFNIDKSFWTLFAIFAILMIIIIPQAPQVISFRLFLELIPIFLFVMGSEIILRVLLINGILNTIKGKKWARSMAIYLSTILFAIVHSPIEGITFSRPDLSSTLALFIGSYLLASIFIEYGSFVFLVIGDMTLYSQVEHIALISIMAFVFYIPVVFIGRRFQKKPIIAIDAG